jgi:hypothetical protein
MLVRISSAADAARLRSLLQRPTGLDDETIDVARSLPPALATEVVVVIVKAQLSRPDPDARAIRAAHLVHALGLVAAVPVLVRCVERLSEVHPVRDAALSALSRLGSGASEALLSALDRSTSVAARTSFAEVLAAAPGRDERIRAALVRMLEYAPAHAARHLARRGEWQALPHVARALDRLALAPIADCPVCAWEDLLALAAAIRSFGGELSDEQEARIEDARDAADDAWVHARPPLGIPAPLRAPVRGTRRPRPAPGRAGRVGTPRARAEAARSTSSATCASTSSTRRTDAQERGPGRAGEGRRERELAPVRRPCGTAQRPEPPPATSCILPSSSSRPSHRPRISTPEILEAAETSSSGFSSTSRRSVRLPTVMVPASSLSPRYSNGLVVELRSAS